MRLLPRSRRGTWLLAGVVWLAACAGLWTELPGVPWATIRLDEHTRLLGFGPVGKTTLVLRGDATGPEYRDQLELWDTASGQFAATLLPSTDSIYVVGQSADGRYWLLYTARGQERHFIRVDLNESIVQPFAKVPLGLESFVERSLSPDGRYCVMHSRNNHEMALWDLVENEIRNLPPELSEPLAFSADGQCLAAFSLDRHNEIRVLNTGDRSVRTVLSGPPGAELDGIAINDDGSRVAASLTIGDGMRGLTCWDTATGLPTDLGDLYLPQFARGQSILFAFGCAEGNTFSPDRWKLSAFDPVSGREIYSDWTGAGGGRPGLVSLNGKSVLTEIESSPEATLFEMVANRLGLVRSVTSWFRITAKARILDAATGRELFGTYVAREARLCGLAPEPDPPLQWVPGRSAVAVKDLEENVWLVYDLPPDKPRTRFAAAAALLALPIAGLALQRVRKLQAVAE